MKLYTEEQVIALTQAAYTAGQNHNAFIFGKKCEDITPIELPSDEEIDEAAKNKINISADCFGQYDFTSGKQDGFMDGAIWMRDKITGGNNEQ
jgi:hypothetical protein